MPKKISSMLEVGSMYSPSITIDFENLGEISELALGSEVVIVVKGTVESLTMREQGEGVEPAGCVRLCDFEAEISPKSNEIQALFEDEDDDE